MDQNSSMKIDRSIFINENWELSILINENWDPSILINENWKCKFFSILINVFWELLFHEWSFF